LPQCHKRLISDIQKIELFLLVSSSAKAFDNCGSSIIFSAWCRRRGHFEFMTVY